jgi:hypothetical protein
MSWINISLNIMSPSMERKLDNVTYMLCMLIGIPLGGCDVLPNFLIDSNVNLK